MARDALDIGVTLNEVLEDFVLLLVAGLQGDAVFPVALGVVVFVLPQVVGLDAQQHVHIGQAHGTVIPCFLPGPQFAAEIAVEADGKALCLGGLQTAQDEIGAALIQGGGDAGQVQPVEAVEQLVQIHLA